MMINSYTLMCNGKQIGEYRNLYKCKRELKLQKKQTPGKYIIEWGLKQK